MVITVLLVVAGDASVGDAGLFGFAALAVGIGANVLLTGRRAMVVDPEGIRVEGTWRPARSFAWRDVRDVSVFHMSQLPNYHGVGGLQVGLLLRSGPPPGTWVHLPAVPLRHPRFRQIAPDIERLARQYIVDHTTRETDQQ